MEQELTMQGTIGSRIEQARLAANIDKNALAALVGKTAKTITHYEKGTNSPTVSTVEDIAKALTVDAGYLFCGAKMVNTKFDETEIEEEKTTKIVYKILSEICKPIEYDGNQLSVGASIGVAFYPKDGRDVLKLADKAMYEAKLREQSKVVLYKDDELGYNQAI